MPEYRIEIDIKDVAEGDVTTLAQDIWDNNAESFDAKLGDFALSIYKVDGSFTSIVDWVPDA
jgi:hypothetical protein